MSEHLAPAYLQSMRFCALWDHYYTERSIFSCSRESLTCSPCWPSVTNSVEYISFRFLCDCEASWITCAW